MLDDEPSDAAQRILSLLESSLHARQLEDAASPSLPPRGPASCAGSLCSGSPWGGSSAIESVVDDRLHSMMAVAKRTGEGLQVALTQLDEKEAQLSAAVARWT